MSQELRDLQRTTGNTKPGPGMTFRVKELISEQEAELLGILVLNTRPGWQRLLFGI